MDVDNYLPNFNEFGNIPSGCHSCSLDNFKNVFVNSFKDSVSRKSRFEGFLKYSKYVCENVNHNIKFIINGSYTTNKIDPNDIDFLIVFNISEISNEEYDFTINEYEKQDDLNNQRHLMVNLAKNGLIDINDTYCCDWYPLYQRNPDDDRYEDYLEDKKYWLDCWGMSRKDENGIAHPKGLIVLELNSKMLEGFK
ncbi:MAG: hypothetical protein LBM96_06925 [Methanobrevibacter sp.]|jgi:hypothetical protein|nr:hypothetical protein [Candidatus Methanoflexus mossambicus]